MGNQHVIELNGKRYDALTGKMIEANPAAASPKKEAANTNKVASIDGFRRSKKTPVNSLKRQTNQATAHPTEKSKTLMRKTVAKPKPVKAATSQVTPTKSITSSKPVMNKQRLEHAKVVPKSAAISRFSATRGTTDSVVAKKSAASSQSTKQVAKPARHTVSTSTANVSSKSNLGTIDKALTDAAAVDSAPLKKDKRTARLARRLHLTPRQVSVGGFAIALVLVVGFFVYQNSTNIGMRIASSRAGINGNLPSYQPAGFGVAGGIAYSPGQITIPYKSTTDNRNFKIMQNVSEWNSQALMDNYVAVNHPNNQTIQDRGKTIYVYDGSNATWVDGGIWYRIEGDSQLNSDQLLNIAASL